PTDPPDTAVKTDRIVNARAVGHPEQSKRLPRGRELRTQIVVAQLDILIPLLAESRVKVEPVQRIFLKDLRQTGAREGFISRVDVNATGRKPIVSDRDDALTIRNGLRDDRQDPDHGRLFGAGNITRIVHEIVGA